MIDTQQTCAMWSKSKSENPTPLTGATSKCAPQRNCPSSSAHCMPNQVSHANCTTTCRSAHKGQVTTIPHGHALPSFPEIFPQGPTSPLVHSCYSPIHDSTQLWDMVVPRIPPAPAPSQIPKYLGIILLQWTRTYLPSHWYRRQRPQETTSYGNWNILGHFIWRCTYRQKKRDNLHKSSVQDTPPKGLPQQDSNHHWRQQNYSPRGCSNPHCFPLTYQYYYEHYHILPLCKFYLLWHEKYIFPPW